VARYRPNLREDLGGCQPLSSTDPNKRGNEMDGSLLSNDPTRASGGKIRRHRLEQKGKILEMRNGTHRWEGRKNGWTGYRKPECRGESTKHIRDPRAGERSRNSFRSDNFQSVSKKRGG